MHRDQQDLAKPPHAFHRLSRPVTHSGRAVTDADYEGVHTTNKFDQAAAYADGAVTKCRCGYRVVLELDVSGLTAMPDIDAVLVAERSMDKEGLAFVKTVVEETDNIDAAIQAVNDRNYESDLSAHVGDPWENYVLESFDLANIPQAFLDAYGDEDEAWDALVEYANGADEATPEVLANLTSQRRWLTDFDESRVLRIIAFKPIWGEILDSWWDMDDEELTAEAERIQEAGYDIVTMETMASYGDAVQTTKLIWERSKSAKSGEFHGTSSDFVRAAFPNLPIPKEPPFPVTEVEEDDE